MITYDMPLYRPPSEGDNLIIQASLGCSFNGCTFCSMYKGKKFRPRSLENVFADIDEAARTWPDAERVFLADGDALTLPWDDLMRILDKLNQTFPALTRVSSYATPLNLLQKTVDELDALRQNKLSLIYFGIESGCAHILKRIRKGATPCSMEEALSKAHAASLKVSATVVLGLGGRAYWQDHVQGTAELVNKQPPRFLSTLQLYLEDSAAGDFMEKFKEPFQMQDDRGILDEQQRLLELIDVRTPVIFRSNHASNCLALAGNLPRDKQRLLNEIKEARSGTVALKPHHLRGL